MRIGWDVPRPRVAFGHGVQTVFTAPGGRRVQVVGCYHVSQQNTQTGRLTESMLDAVLLDALALARGGDVVTGPSTRDCARGHRHRSPERL